MKVCVTQCSCDPMACRELGLTPSLPRVINFKFPLQPHQKYYITQCELLGSHSLLRWKMITLPILPNSLIDFSLKGWENELVELGSERVRHDTAELKTFFHAPKRSRSGMN